jgi:beta-lactamase class D
LKIDTVLREFGDKMSETEKKVWLDVGLTQSAPPQCEFFFKKNLSFKSIYQNKTSSHIEHFQVFH